MMNFIKRAIFSFIYYIKKNILLFLVYLIVALLFISIYCLRHETIVSMKNVEKSIGASVLVCKKDSNHYPFWKQNFFSYDIAKNIAQASEVKERSYFSTSGAEGIDIEGIFNDDEKIFLITAITNTEEHWDFKQGGEKEQKLLKGRFLTKEDEDKPYAIINEEIAKDNDFGIGDKFIIQSYLHKEVIIELEIVGIFCAKDSGKYGGLFDSCNNIYTSIGVCASLNGGDIMEAEYILNDPNDVKSFIDKSLKVSKDVKDIVISEKSSDFIEALTSMDSLIKVCNIILFSTILMATIILSLLVMYIMIGRFREIGILLAMGESKFRIIFQITSETIVPMLIAITAAIFISKILIVPSIGKWIKVNLGVNGISLGNSIFLMYFIGLALSILSIFAPAFNVLMYKHKKYLIDFNS